MSVLLQYCYIGPIRCQYFTLCTLDQSQLVPHRVDLGAPGVGADPVELPRRALADSRAQQLPAQGASIVSDLAEAGAIQELCLWLSSYIYSLLPCFVFIHEENDSLKQ